MPFPPAGMLGGMHGFYPTLLLLALFSTYLQAAEEEVRLKAIPAEAAEALRQRAGKAKITHVSKENDDGKVVYEASFAAEGGIREVSVDSNGKLLSEEQTVEFGSLPGKVQKTISAKVAGGKIEKIERVEENGAKNYEALLFTKSGRVEIVVNGNGKIVKTDEKKESDRD